MLRDIDLSQKVTKQEYKRRKEPLSDRLGRLQRRARDLGVPVVIVFEGWDASGKGTLINNLILPLDPRGFTVHTFSRTSEAERLRPFLWRFWVRLPGNGRQAVFDRSWYIRLLDGRVEKDLDPQQVLQAVEDIRSFERQLTDGGVVIIKFFLHISRKTQGKRLSKLRKDPATRWRVTKEDLKRHKSYDAYLAAVDEMIAETDTDFAPWSVVEARDKRFATLKVFETVADTLSDRLDAIERRPGEPTDAAEPFSPADALGSSVLAGVDLSLTLDRESYAEQLKDLQRRLRTLQHRAYRRRLPVVMVYEGWDAAGKGGNIRRLTRRLDPRGYDVIPIAAPNDAEKAHHYLWRFWREMPKAGHFAIFDRSWYGRVLVERVEGFASPHEWRRAYREINEMEEHLAHYPTVVLKFWLQIDPAEQLRRFEARRADANKRWKITDEDWRNREKWDAYAAAVDEMIRRTATPHAPWTVVESNCKRYARVKVLRTACEAIERGLSGAD